MHPNRDHVGACTDPSRKECHEEEEGQEREKGAMCSAVGLVRSGRQSPSPRPTVKSQAPSTLGKSLS